MHFESVPIFQIRRIYLTQVYHVMYSHRTASYHTPSPVPFSWWRHQMEAYSVTLVFCAGNSSVTGDFPAQRPVTRSFDVFFDLRMNQNLSKQWRRRWFETPSHSLWRHCNGPECQRHDKLVTVIGSTHSVQTKWITSTQACNPNETKDCNS